MIQVTEAAPNGTYLTPEHADKQGFSQSEPHHHRIGFQGFVAAGHEHAEREPAATLETGEPTIPLAERLPHTLAACLTTWPTTTHA